MGDSNKIARRALLQFAPALAFAQQGTRPAPPPEVVSKEMLRNALTIAGLEFTDGQLTMMIPEMNRNIPSYQALRKREVPLDTEPAIHFRPNPPRSVIRDAKHAFRPTRAKARPHRPANLESLAFAPVTVLGPLLKAKQVTSVELTAMYLARLKRYGPKLNCVITLTEDLAMEQARKADEELRHGRYRGPLHGVPYGAKDLFNTKGILTTWGAEPYQKQIPDNDATVVVKMRDAGAVLLAKLSMGALAQGGLWFGGMTKNPWNTEQTSSGSSAGSASATSAGLVGFSLGTETLGSIVSPSTRCGVTGLRPTYGRISRAGAMGLSWTMDKVGPICRSVEDCALVLHAAYGPGGQDSTVRDIPFAWTPALPLANLRIGVLQTEFDRVQGEAKDLYTAALAALGKAGAQLKPVVLPDMGADALRMILTAEAATAFDDITRDGRVSQLKGQTANDWPNTFRAARTIPAVEYIRAQRARTLLMTQMDKFMADWDVLVSPTGSATLLITNLTGHPQVTVPCGFVNQVPAGLLFTGPLYEEGTPLRAALAFEQSTDWHNMHPKVDW